jgi:hypothetical protein
MLHTILFVSKRDELTFFLKECNNLLVIRYLIFVVTVPLQLLVTAIENVMKKLLVTTESN